jgi:MFS family permease
VIKAIQSLTADGRLLFATRFVRLFAYGALSVVLVLYLVGLGLSESDTGVLLTAALLGDTLVSLYLTTRADRFGRRRMLIIGASLMAAAGVAFAFTRQMWLLVVAGTIGVISPSGHEVGPFLPIEQAALSQVVPARARTDVFAWWTFAGSIATALGALAAGLLTDSLQHRWTRVDSYRAVVVLYACIGVALCGLFLKASTAIEAPRTLQAAPPPSPLARLSGLHESQAVVLRLSALFALDSFGGGFVVQSFAAYWFYLRFGVDPKTLGALFFGANVFAGLSALVASRLANRIGLVNTMVVTHLPSNVLLMLIPLMPTLPLASLMLLLRFSISQMDVPTRQSYTMAVVPPEERAAASGITGVARTTGAALSPLFAGLLFAQPSLINVPFYIAGILKITYDLLLFRSFRALKPPEEIARTGLVMLVLFAAGGTAFAQNGPPFVRAASDSTKILIDGRLTETGRASADGIEDVRQRDPGAAPSARTRVQVLADPAWAHSPAVARDMCSPSTRAARLHVGLIRRRRLAANARLTCPSRLTIIRAVCDRSGARSPGWH